MIVCIRTNRKRSGGKKKPVLLHERMWHEDERRGLCKRMRGKVIGKKPEPDLIKPDPMSKEGNMQEHSGNRWPKEWPKYVPASPHEIEPWEG